MAMVRTPSSTPVEAAAAAVSAASAAVVEVVEPEPQAARDRASIRLSTRQVIFLIFFYLFFDFFRKLSDTKNRIAYAGDPGKIRRNKETCRPDPTIALHINVTVRQMFSDGPAGKDLAFFSGFGGVSFCSLRLQDLGERDS